MPSKSPAQARLMRAVAKGWKPDRIKGPTQAVAQEFVNADKRRGKVEGYQYGGSARFGRMQRKPQMGALSRDPRAMPPQQVTGGPSPMRPMPPPRMSTPLRKPMPGRMQVPPSPPPGYGSRGYMQQQERERQMRQRRGGPGGPGTAIGGPMAGMRLPGGVGGRMGPQGATGMMRQLFENARGNMGPRRGGPMMPPRRGGFPGGGNPMMGGRNPYMAMSRRFNPRTMMP